jgi:transposase
MNTHAFLAADVSKGYADFLLSGSDKQALEADFSLDDTPEGRKTLAALIGRWASKGLRELYCGLESTGGYENNWFTFLCNLAGRCRGTNLELKVARLNPKAVKACGEAALVRTQTDAVSARNIASYMIGWPEKITYSPRGEDAEDRRWLAARQQARLTAMLTKQKTQLSNQLEKLLYQQLSELLVYCRHGLPVWLLRLLTRYPSRQQLLQAGKTNVASTRGISTEKAESLVKKLDPAAPEASSTVAHTIRANARQILHLHTQISDEQAFLTSQYKDHPNVKLLASIKGVGITSAVRMAVEIQDITRFAGANQLCAYFGVHPTWKQSGDGNWKKGMSKQGRPQMRAILYMCSLSGIRCNDILKKRYCHFRTQGMNHYQAMGGVMHKLLRMVYGILSSSKPYDPDIDRMNRRKAAKHRRQQADNRKGRKQGQKKGKDRYKQHPQPDETSQPPISRRAYQKRKQAASQSSVVEEYAGSPPAD